MEEQAGKSVQCANIYPSGRYLGEEIEKLYKLNKIYLLKEKKNLQFSTNARSQL